MKKKYLKEYSTPDFLNVDDLHAKWNYDAYPFIQTTEGMVYGPEGSKHNDLNNYIIAKILGYDVETINAVENEDYTYYEDGKDNSDGYEVNHITYYILEKDLKTIISIEITYSDWTKSSRGTFEYTKQNVYNYLSEHGVHGHVIDSITNDIMNNKYTNKIYGNGYVLDVYEEAESDGEPYYDINDEEFSEEDFDEIYYYVKGKGIYELPELTWNFGRIWPNIGDNYESYISLWLNNRLENADIDYDYGKDDTSGQFQVYNDSDDWHGDYLPSKLSDEKINTLKTVFEDFNCDLDNSFVCIGDNTIPIMKLINGEEELDITDEMIEKDNQLQAIHLLPPEIKKEKLRGWMDMHNHVMYKKLAYRDHEGNIRTDKEPMTLAQYHSLIYQENKQYHPEAEDGDEYTIGFDGMGNADDFGHIMSENKKTSKKIYINEDKLSLIKENITDIIYHFTPINNLKQILKYNYFSLKELETNEIKEPRDKYFYYLSTTRNKRGDTGFPLMCLEGENKSRITLDGKLINNNPNVIAKAVDYFQPNNGNKTQKHKMGDKTSNFEFSRRIHSMEIESEDRIFSKKNKLENANKYIIRIDIFQNQENKIDKNFIGLLQYLGLADKTFVYENEKDFDIQNKNCVNIESLFNTLQENTNLLSEGVESKNMKLAKHYLYDNCNYDEGEAMRIIGSIKTDVPNVRLAKCKFILGLTRMFVQGELNDANMVMGINKSLKYIASDAHINEYNNDLNGMHCAELIKRFEGVAKMDLENDMDKLSKEPIDLMKYSDSINIKESILKETHESILYHVTWCQFLPSIVNKGLMIGGYVDDYGETEEDIYNPRNSQFKDKSISLSRVSNFNIHYSNKLFVRLTIDGNALQNRGDVVIKPVNAFKASSPTRFSDGEWEDFSEKEERIWKINDKHHDGDYLSNPQNYITAIDVFYSDGDEWELNLYKNKEFKNLPEWAKQRMHFYPYDKFNQPLRLKENIEQEAQFSCDEGEINGVSFRYDNKNARPFVYRIREKELFFGDKGSMHMDAIAYHLFGVESGFNVTGGNLDLIGCIQRSSNTILGRVWVNNNPKIQYKLLIAFWPRDCDYNMNDDIPVSLNSINTSFYKELSKEVCDRLKINYDEAAIIQPTFHGKEEKEIKLYTLKENIEQEVTPSEVDTSSFVKQNELQPEIWRNGQLNPKLRLKLLDIADDFYNSLDIPWVKPKDIILTGSICNFNWSKFSDIDLHIIVDFKEINDKTDFVKTFFDSKKNEWNEQHSKLEMFGFLVELYVQDITENAISSGVYSLEQNKWIKEPNPNDTKDLSEIDTVKLKMAASSIMTIIDDIENEYNNTTDKHQLEVLNDKIEHLCHKLKELRTNGLDKNGEMSISNLVYKILRRTEYLDKIWKISDEIYDKVNSINENIKYGK